MGCGVSSADASSEGCRHTPSSTSAHYAAAAFAAAGAETDFTGVGARQDHQRQPTPYAHSTDQLTGTASRRGGLPSPRIITTATVAAPAIWLPDAPPASPGALNDDDTNSTTTHGREGESAGDDSVGSPLWVSPRTPPSRAAREGDVSSAAVDRRRSSRLQSLQPQPAAQQVSAAAVGHHHVHALVRRHSSRVTSLGSFSSAIGSTAASSRGGSMFLSYGGSDSEFVGDGLTTVASAGFMPDSNSAAAVAEDATAADAADHNPLLVDLGVDAVGRELLPAPATYATVFQVIPPPSAATTSLPQQNYRRRGIASEGCDGRGSSAIELRRSRIHPPVPTM